MPPKACAEPAIIVSPDGPQATVLAPLNQARLPCSEDPVLTRGSIEDAKCDMDYDPDLAQFQAYLDDLDKPDMQALETNQKGVVTQTTGTADSAAHQKPPAGCTQETNTHGPPDKCLVLPCLNPSRLHSSVAFAALRQHEAANSIGQFWRLRKLWPLLALTDLKRLMESQRYSAK